MQTGLVTVVIPIYKTEKYLDRCITSIVNQTYTNLEILLIDDGSPDTCPQMCDTWAERDARIRVIHKKNEGLGMARNTGIENATGEYICFFDSDDYIAVDTIEKAYGRLAAEQAEVVIFGFSNVNADGKITSSFPPISDCQSYRGAQVQGTFLPELIAPNPKGDGVRHFYMSAWVMLYSVEMIRKNQWHFVSEREIISEDIYSLLHLFKYVTSVVILPEALYFYRKNVQSLSRVYVPGRYIKIRHFYLECLSLCDRLEYSEDIKRRIAMPYLANTLAALKQVMEAQLAYSECKNYIREIIDDFTLQRVLQEIKGSHFKMSRRIMFFSMRHKLYWLCGALLQARLKQER